jgi:hypothetical protein
MNIETNILFAVHEGAPFVGHDGNNHNLLPKGRPLIMRFRQLSRPVLIKPVRAKGGLLPVGRDAFRIPGAVQGKKSPLVSV